MPHQCPVDRNSCEVVDAFALRFTRRGERATARLVESIGHVVDCLPCDRCRGAEQRVAQLQRMRLGKHELVPIMIGGMGVDISTAELALEAARLGGIGHISDAMVPTVSDRRFKTGFVAEKLKKYKYNVASRDKSAVQFDLDRLVEATQLHVGRTMEAKKGDGLVFINCMEKLTMNAPRETLRTRLTAAMDAGIDGITLSAGLHLGSLGLVQDHPRFRDVHFGIIVSSLRALLLFLRKNARLNRLPDYIVVEGPLAGGHLGFGMDWAQYDLATIVAEIRAWLAVEKLDIPLILLAERIRAGMLNAQNANDSFAYSEGHRQL